MVRRMWFGLCLIAIAAMLTGVAWAADDQAECLGLYYRGDLFDNFGATCLSAQVGCPCTCAPSPTFLPNAGAWFDVQDLWGIRRTIGAANTLLTSSVGSIFQSINVGSGVYQVQAFGAAGGLLDGVSSPPVALTVFNCAPGIGIASGGALNLATCRKTACDETGPFDVDGSGTCGCIDYTCRRATFGLFYDVWKPTIDTHRLQEMVGKPKPFIEIKLDIPLPDSRNEQLLFLDPCNPDGAVKVKATSFRTATLPVLVHINIIPSYVYIKFEGLKLTGYCEYSVNGEQPQTKYFEAVLSHHYYIISQSPYLVFRDATFDIRVWEYPNTTLYKACGQIENGGSRIF